MMERVQRIRLTPERSLLLTFLFTTTVILVRTWWTIRGGWFVGDEALYICSMMESVQAKRFVYISVRHIPFMWTNTVFGWLLDLDSVFRAIPFLAIQAFFWNGICTWALYKVVKKMGLKENSQSIVFLTASMMPVYVLMNGLYLTEAPSMAFALLSIYYLLSGMEGKHAQDFFLAGLTISIAYMYREPYLTFLALDTLLIGYLVVRKRLRPVHLILFVLAPIALVDLPTNIITLTIVKWYADLRNAGLEVWKNLVVEPILEALPITLPNTTFGAIDEAHLIFVSDEIELGVGNLSFSGDILYRVETTLLVLWRGLLYGWSIILTLPVVLGLLESFRKWKTNDQSKVVAITGLAAFLSLLIMGWFMSPASYLRQSGAVSIAIRFAYTTFPMVLGLGVLYERIDIDPRKVIIVLGVGTLLFIPTVLMKFQSNQSDEVINRVDLSYTAAYYRMYQYLKGLPGEILVIPEPGFRASLYLRTLDRVNLTRMDKTEAEFLNLTARYDRIFFYQEKWPRWEAVHEDQFHFMKEVVRNNTQYQVAVIWDTPEAYLYEWIP